jgi:hypothetical protein
LELNIENAELVSSYWGHGQPWHVMEQLPRPGRRMSSRVIVVRVSLRDRWGDAGVRAPRCPLPPDQPLQADTGTDRMCPLAAHYGTDFLRPLMKDSASQNKQAARPMARMTMLSVEGSSEVTARAST